MHLLAATGLLGLAWWHGGAELFLAWYSGMDAEIRPATWWATATTSAMLAVAAVPLLWSACR
jgi:hypothetical protein